ncbi:hypothetical protein BGZ76_011328 [Entomortierella beljakovae]|nr:hypothetical protein BGZ76_011328 [Entomortierella beljakovae]
MRRQIHVQLYGQSSSPIPTSPLRKEFGRDCDSICDSDDSQLSTKHRNSEAISLLSHGFRNMLTSMTNKHKYKNSGAHRNQDGFNSDPFQNSYDVDDSDVAEVVQVNHVFTSPNSQFEDPYAIGGGYGDDNLDPDRASIHHSVHERAESVVTAPGELKACVEKLKPTLGPLLESMTSTPTKSIMGKAIAIDIDDQVLQARPGHVGEFPTPVGLHPLLDKEDELIRDHTCEWEKEKISKPKAEKDDASNAEMLMIQDTNLTDSLPISHDPFTTKSSSLPLKPKVWTLPDPLPVETAGVEIPEGIPFNNHEAAMPPKGPDTDDDFEELLDENSTHHAPPGMSHGPSQPSDSETSIAPRDLDMKKFDREPMFDETVSQGIEFEKPSLSPDLSIDPMFVEPSIASSTVERNTPAMQLLEDNAQSVTDNRLSKEVELEKEHAIHAAATPTTSSVDVAVVAVEAPASTKKQHRGIFKRMIRKKSHDSTKDSSIYKNPGISKSQSSLVGSSSSRSISNLFHRHHNKSISSDLSQPQPQEEKQQQRHSLPPLDGLSQSHPEDEVTRVGSRPRSSTLHT